MLATLLLGSLITCVLIMLAGWVHDGLVRDSDVGETCPLFPVSSPLSGRERTPWSINP
jgi:hypothetical protein